MHRTTRVPRPLAWGVRIALLALLLLGARFAAAQEQLPPPAAAGVAAEPPSRTELLSANQTRRIGMTSKLPIVDLQNENPGLVRIDKVDKDPTTVFVTGLTAGTARLLFTDINKKVEQVLIRVDDAERRRLELIDLIRQIAPTAAVQVATAPNNTVILTGYVTDVDTAQRLMEAARGVFTVRQGQGGQSLVPAIVYNGMTIGGVQQVQLEVILAAVNRSRLRQMAFNFYGNSATNTFNSTFAANNFANSLAVAPTAAIGNLLSAPGNLTWGILNNSHSFTAYLQALNTEQLTKILADSRLTTVSGRPASLTSGGQTPILTSTGIGAPSVTYQPFGTVVKFLPIVQNGKIHLEVHAEVSSINAALGITLPGSVATNVPGFDARLAEVAVQLEDGQTLAIGGLIQTNINATIQRVPILGDLPFIGTLFTTKTYNDVEEELLIIVTPRLVDGVSCDKIPKYLPGRESRNPDDFELFLEGIMEAPRGPRYISINPFHYKGAHTLSPNAGQIPCAGSGNGLSGCATCSSIPALTGPALGAPAMAPRTPAPARLPSPVPLPKDLPVSYVPQPLPTPAVNAISPGSIPVPQDPAPPAVLPGPGRGER